MSEPRSLEKWAIEAMSRLVGYYDVKPHDYPAGCQIIEDVLHAYAEQARREEREAWARIGDERAKEFEQKRATHQMDEEESWWRARKVEAQDYAAALRGRENR